MQLPMFETGSQWRPPLLSELPEWKNAKRIGIDCETCDPTLRSLGIGVRRNGYVVGVSFAIEDGPKLYLPLRHKGGDNAESPEAALRYRREQAASLTGDLV